MAATGKRFKAEQIVNIERVLHAPTQPITAGHADVARPADGGRVVH